jgi:uncharacterized protein with gpF-like domain
MKGRTYNMSIFSTLMSAIRGRGRSRLGVASAERAEPPRVIPTVKFDPERVTDAVKSDLKRNIKKIKEFDGSNFDRIFDALRSISRGRDLATLFNAIMELNLPNMTKQRASEISLDLNNKATARMNRDRQASIGIKYATWVYSGAPCYVNLKKPLAKDIRQDTAHREANGKRYSVAKGMLLNRRLTTPGREAGCKCISRSIIPGLDP